jgi:hypothetical protein
VDLLHVNHAFDVAKDSDSFVVYLGHDPARKPGGFLLALSVHVPFEVLVDAAFGGFVEARLLFVVAVAKIVAGARGADCGEMSAKDEAQRLEWMLQLKNSGRSGAWEQPSDS